MEGIKLSERNENLTHYNDQYSTEIDYKYKTNTRYQRYLVELLEKEMNHVPESVLDVGCGQGLNTVKFAEDWPESKVVGVDLSDIGINYANYHYGSRKNVSFVCMDVSKMVNDGEKFDLVTAFELLEHIEDWEKVAIEMTQISNRYIMVSVPIGRMRDHEKAVHFRNYQKGELENFFEKHGFRTVKTYYAGFPFWSPITRDLLNFLLTETETTVQGEMGAANKVISLTLYYLFRYFSFKNRGDQFVGLFERI